jgi:hypothetical protein
MTLRTLKCKLDLASERFRNIILTKKVITTAYVICINNRTLKMNSTIPKLKRRELSTKLRTDNRIQSLKIGRVT